MHATDMTINCFTCKHMKRIHYLSRFIAFCMEHDFPLENVIQADPLLKTNTRFIICKDFELHADFPLLEPHFKAFQIEIGGKLKDKYLYTFQPETCKVEEYKDITTLTSE